MTKPLAAERCEACRADAPKLDATEVEELRLGVMEWMVVEEDGVQKLIREFTFTDFVKALEFTNRVGALAEEENHHPALLTEWGRVTVSWWTHKVRGLHRNDFVMAAKTDPLCS
jgi:4a-hydroxytetrahydrobiopterin dehydratase